VIGSSIIHGIHENVPIVVSQKVWQLYLANAALESALIYTKLHFGRSDTKAGSTSPGSHDAFFAKFEINASKEMNAEEAHLVSKTGDRAAWSEQCAAPHVARMRDLIDFGTTSIQYWPGFVTTVRDWPIVAGPSPEAEITPAGCSKLNVLDGLVSILSRDGFRSYVVKERERIGETGQFIYLETYW
jgi:hypothetical protein